MAARENSYSHLPVYGPPWHDGGGQTPNNCFQGYNRLDLIDKRSYIGHLDGQQWPSDPGMQFYADPQYNTHQTTNLQPRHDAPAYDDQLALAGLVAELDALHDLPMHAGIESMSMEALITDPQSRPAAFTGRSNVTLHIQTDRHAGYHGAMSDPGAGLDRIVERSEEEASSEEDSAYQTLATDVASNADTVNQLSSRHGVRRRLDRSQDFNVSSQHMQRPTLIIPGSDSQRPGSGLKGKRRASIEQAKCTYCATYVPKNASDAFKHRNKHEKPFKCEYPECQRKQIGFATTNDRDRHYKSGRHNRRPELGSGKGYVCSACPVAPESDAKWWPRLDNFKAHVRRRHKYAHIDTLVKASERDATARPVDTVTEFGDNSTHYPGTSLVDRDERYQNMDPLSTTDPTMSGSFAVVRGEHSTWPDEESSQVSASDQLAGVGKAHHLADPFASRQCDIASSYGPDEHGYYTGLLEIPDTVMTDMVTSAQEVPAIVLSPADKSPKRHLDFTWDSSEAKRACREPLEQLSLDSHECDRDGLFVCGWSGCQKTKQRKCDLRKHMKRHVRPYGCTFPRCHARQGSRSDWKRHEEKQHSVRQSWKCTLEGTHGKPCYANFYSDQAFEHHLEQKHSCSKQDIAGHRNAMHLGKDAHHQFWCGFCNRIVPCDTSTKLNAKESRLAHIGEHVDKDGRQIDDWICLEMNKPHSLIRKEELRQTRLDYNRLRLEGFGELSLNDIMGITPPGASTSISNELFDGLLSQ